MGWMSRLPAARTAQTQPSPAGRAASLGSSFFASLVWADYIVWRFTSVACNRAQTNSACSYLILKVLTTYKKPVSLRIDRSRGFIPGLKIETWGSRTLIRGLAYSMPGLWRRLVLAV